MCTVSFVPLNKNHFILTSNRDETVARGLASSPVIIQKEGYQLVYPVDPLASGTWIAASGYGDVVCLLNGAFKKHRHLPPYRKSRGLVVLDYFDVGDPEKFAAAYDLSGIEPFTMVILCGSAYTQLYELRWDGNQKYFKKMNEDEHHQWSSVTLYNEELIEKKNIRFEEELTDLAKKGPVDPAGMVNIHKGFLYEDWVKPPERVDVVATLSITAVESNGEWIRMHYRDLVRKELPEAVMGLTIMERKP